MFVTVWFSFLVVLALIRYFFPSDFEKAKTNKPREISSEDNEQSSRIVEECSSALAEQTPTASSANQRTLSPSVDQTSPSSSVDQTSPLSSVGLTSASSSADQASPFASIGQTSASSSADQTSPLSSVGQTSASTTADKASASPSADQTSPFSSVGQASASSSADQASASFFADKTSASTSADETSTSPSTDQTSSSSAEQTSSSCADQRSLSPSADEKPPWQSAQTSTSSSADQKSPLPFVEQTFTSPSADQTSLLHDAGQRSPSTSFDQTSPADQTPASSSASHTYPSPCASKRFTSSSSDPTFLSPAADQKSLSYADQTSTLSYASQTYPSSCANQKFPSSFAYQKSLPLSAEQGSPSLSAEQRSSSSADQTCFSLFADQTSLSLSAEQRSPTLSADQRSTSSSANQTWFSLFAEQRAPSLSRDQRSTPLPANQTRFSLFADQKTLSPSAEQRSSSLSADQRSASSYANQTYFSLFADQISLSLSAEQRSLSLSADRSSTSSYSNQKPFSLFADQISISPFAEQRSPPLSSDQRFTSSSTNQISFSLFADQTSLSQSAEQRSPSLSANQRSTSSCNNQTFFSLFADQTSRLSTSNQTPNSLFADLRFPFSYADQISSAEQKKSLPTSSYQTNSFSLFPDQGCSSSTFLGQESSILPFGGKSNSLSAVYCQTKPAGIILESKPNVKTSCVSRPTIEEAPRPHALSPPCSMPSGPSKCHTRPTVPTIAETTFLMLNESPGPSTIGQTTTSLYVPVSAAIRPLMSCDVRPPALSSHMSVPTTPSVPNSNIGFDTMFPTPTGCYIPASIFSASGTYGGTCITGSVLIRPVMSCDVRPSHPPSLRGIPTRTPVPSSNVNFEIRFPTPTGYSMSNSAPRTYENTFNVPGTGPRIGCDVRPPAIHSSLMSIQTTASVPSFNFNCASSFPTPSGYSMPSSVSVTYGNTFGVPQSVSTRPLMNCDVRPPAIPNVMSIQTTPPVPISNFNFGSRFPTPSGYSVPNSASITYGNTSCAPQSVTVRPKVSCDVRPKAIPSLMSIQTTPPLPSTNVNFGSRYPTPSGYSMPSRASKTNGNTYTVPQSVTGPKTIPSLMSNQTSSPVPFDNIRLLRNTGNRRRVPDSITTTIPSLMSIKTRPPWEPIRSQPPGNPYW